MKLIKWVPRLQNKYVLSKECNIYMHDNCVLYYSCICPCHGETKVEEVEYEDLSTSRTDTSNSW